ncbi:hypothetical protein CASFOL_008999 [Castilleja foliolosa]|uniref:Exocyst complex component EXOC6/Sec15 N-terminal domain-containing protein n=1 Tax=Castilleja foliolosa TaxID=1961234 RepID=A0ABD3E1P1_9LAMI
MAIPALCPRNHGQQRRGPRAHGPASLQHREARGPISPAQGLSNKRKKSKLRRLNPSSRAITTGFNRSAARCSRNLRSLLESYSVNNNVTEAIKMSTNCVQILDLCVKCNDYVSGARFYPALKAVDLIEKSYLQNIPVRALKLLIGNTLPILKSHIKKRRTCWPVRGRPRRFGLRGFELHSRRRGDR